MIEGRTVSRYNGGRTGRAVGGGQGDKLHPETNRPHDHPLHTTHTLQVGPTITKHNTLTNNRYILLNVIIFI